MNLYKGTYKALIFILLLIVAAQVKSQDGHLALKMGPSFPLNDYAAVTDYTANGYATPGFVLSFEGNYIPTWYFGVGGAITFSTNYPNQDSMIYGLVQELIKIDGLEGLADNIEPDFVTNNWSYVNFLIGPTLAYPAGNLQFNFKALLGMSVIMPPSQTLTATQRNSNIKTTSDVQNFKFCYSFGTDIILKLSGNYSIMLGAEYFSTKTSHNVKVALNDETSISSINREFNIDAVHATFGLAYLF